jgi:hypothetical protein
VFGRTALCSFSYVDMKRLVRKIDLKIMVWAFLMFFCLDLDRYECWFSLSVSSLPLAQVQHLAGERIFDQLVGLGNNECGPPGKLGQLPGRPSYHHGRLQ